MSRADDRIAVPTNGHARPLDGEARSVTPDGDTEPRATPNRASDLTIAFTPGQLAVGFGILASIILLLAGRRRRRRGS